MIFSYLISIRSFQRVIPTHKFTPNAKSGLSLEHAEKLFLESAFPLISDIIFSQREGGDVSGASLQRSLRPVRSSSTDGPIVSPKGGRSGR